MPPPNQEGWWAEYFHKHPLKNDRNSIAYAPNGKVKCYCKLCMAKHVAEVQLMHERASQANQTNEDWPRELDAIISHCECLNMS